MKTALFTNGEIKVKREKLNEKKKKDEKKIGIVVGI
jgi:hypothetical protein